MKPKTLDKPQTTRGKLTGNGFSFGSPRSYVDNAELASEKRTFDILEIDFEPGKGYEGQDRWLITVKSAGREPEYLSLGANPKRDGELREAQAHLETGGTITNKRLHRSGNAYYFMNVE